MTARYDGDCCPLCGGDEVTPYAIIVGAREEYGYHCQVCQVIWRVLVYDGDTAAATGSRPR